MMRVAYLAFGLAAVVGGVPASFAQDSRVPSHGESTASGTGADERKTDQGPGGNAGISVAVPIGRVLAGPELVDGEPVYVRRTTGSGGMTIVEVSTTPFMPALASTGRPPGVDQSIVRPDQPASW